MLPVPKMKTLKGARLGGAKDMAVGEALRQKLPERISKLDLLANNTWWSWHPQARDLFRALDYPVWKESGHNPVKQLREIGPDKLEAAANDPIFLRQFDGVIAAFEADMLARDTPFTVNHSKPLDGPVAYFCMEFAIHNSLPIYAGGLGVLAGDICKEASDLGLPLVGVGFMYPQGYCHQRISPEGQQEETCSFLDFDEAPINSVLSPEGDRVLVKVEWGIGWCLLVCGRLGLAVLAFICWTRMWRKMPLKTVSFLHASMLRIGSSAFSRMLFWALEE